MLANDTLTKEVLHFKVNDVLMCVYLKYIEKILPLVSLENVPGSPYYLAGLMNLAGKNIPVIDLALRTGLDRCEPYSINAPVILCSNGIKEVAMIVDSIIGLKELNDNEIQMSEEFNRPNSPFLASLVNNLESSLLINVNYLVEISLRDENDSNDKEN